jgi:hypothetical protein
VSTCSLVRGMAAVDTPAAEEEARERNPQPHPDIPRRSFGRSPDRCSGWDMAELALAAADTAALVVVVDTAAVAVAVLADTEAEMVACSARDRERRLAAAPEPRRSWYWGRPDSHLPGRQRCYR